MGRSPRDDPREDIEIPPHVDESINPPYKRKALRIGPDELKREQKNRATAKARRKEQKALAKIERLKPNEATGVILEKLLNYKGENADKTSLPAVDLFVRMVYEAMEQTGDDMKPTPLALKAGELFFKAAFSPEMLKAARQGQNTSQLFAQIDATAASLTRAATQKKYADKYQDTEATEKPENGA
jgi:hypothetical protein